jgi:DNA-binding MarR family transcriptional regulator
MRPSKPHRDYVAIARFRAALRAYENAAEGAARAAELTPQRYLLLLMVKGAPGGGERATINNLAERLRVEPHSVTGAVTRAEEAGLVVREACEQDRRRTWIRLTAEGERRLACAVAALENQRDELLEALEHVAAGARAVPAPSGDAAAAYEAIEAAASCRESRRVP